MLESTEQNSSANSFQGVFPEMVDTAVERGPIAAGVPQDIIDKLAKGSIDFETTKVTAISAAAGLPEERL